MKITETEEGRSLGETEAEAEVRRVMDCGMSRSTSTSELYSMVSAEEERRVQIGGPTLGARNIRR
jgi:hypothetical protein